MTKDTRFDVSRTRRALLKGAAVGGLLLAGSGVHAATGNGKTLRFGVIGPARAPAAPTGYALDRGYLQRELAPLGFNDVRFDMFANGPKPSSRERSMSASTATLPPWWRARRGSKGS